jgi:hypothetical protein
MNEPTMISTNADLIAGVAEIHLPRGAKVADISHGKGVFWQKIDCARISLYGSDLHVVAPEQSGLFRDRQLMRADFRHLPYADGSLDVVVFDPPYTHDPGNHMTDQSYRLAATAKGMCHADIMAELYGKGIKEAARVLKNDGGKSRAEYRDGLISKFTAWRLS